MQMQVHTGSLLHPVNHIFSLAKFLNCHFFQIGILKIAGGGRFVSVFTFLNRSDEQVKLHPFVLFEGSDARQNLEQTIGKFTEEIRNIEGKEVEVGNKKLKVKVFGLFDLSALNAIIGKQNHEVHIRHLKLSFIIINL